MPNTIQHQASPQHRRLPDRPGVRAPVEISIDGERVFVAQVGGEEDNRASDLAMSATADKIDERLKKRVFVKAGPRMVGVTFISGITPSRTNRCSRTSAITICRT